MISAYWLIPAITIAYLYCGAYVFLAFVDLLDALIYRR